MKTLDECVTILPYFRVHPGKMDQFKELCNRCVATTNNEIDCLYYGFSFHGDEVHCREGYTNAEGVLAHVQNAGNLIQEALTLADLYRMEVHGTTEQLEKLKSPLAPFKPEYWTLECGFRREAVA